VNPGPEQLAALKRERERLATELRAAARPAARRSAPNSRFGG
jgi:hypothetical protein